MPPLRGQPKHWCWCSIISTDCTRGLKVRRWKRSASSSSPIRRGAISSPVRRGRLTADDARSRTLDRRAGGACAAVVSAGFPRDARTGDGRADSAHHWAGKILPSAPRLEQCLPGCPGHGSRTSSLLLSLPLQALRKRRKEERTPPPSTKGEPGETAQEPKHRLIQSSLL